ncbi:hypothetical protein AYW79_05980 [Ferroacidibacillus organovorans]|uniref:Uncharacterized protein n=1 Tax=Ferroacidibacillus organovorans TaxID=1765683 RepID=A0A161QG33_9BACL|nr:hypothetical protein AYJ22_09165 [Ferroacidibacillus organovorans]OAG94280.1 hypothetical protein AYW79_05980 [Ferroacidibacillus organovorans]OPG16481.1 hypothetical protein B2M26_06280 [Ferroacidibacillus organovorans]
MVPLNEYHMRKAGREFSKGAHNAQDKAQNGQMLNAAGEAISGTANAAVELGKSAVERVSAVVNPDHR